MYNELTYDAWLTEGNKFKHRYYQLQSAGLMTWSAVTALCVMGLKYGVLMSAVIGFVPYFLMYLAAMTYYEKWQNCEDKYNHHIPFVDVRMVNAALAAVEFEDQTVVAHYLTPEGSIAATRIPADKVRLLPAEDELDTVKLRKNYNNFTEKEEWVFAEIYLTPRMQNKLVELLQSR